MPYSQTTSNLSKAYSVPSDKLKELRELVSASADLQKLVGVAVRFKLVVDANVILGDIRWLAFKRKNDKARTSLLETIAAGTVDVYVPPSLFDEVEEHIDRFAREEGLDKEAMHVQWREYQSKLTVCEPDSEVVRDLQQKEGDPDDAFYVALAAMIGAPGVVSNDRDIEQLGGNRISVECIVSLREYSRAAAIECHIKCMGVTLGKVAGVAILGLIAGVKSLIEGIGKAPDWLKLVMLLVALYCIFNPEAREKILRLARTAFAGIGKGASALIAHVAEAAALAEQQKQASLRHLNDASEKMSIQRD